MIPQSSVIPYTCKLTAQSSFSLDDPAGPCDQSCMYSHYSSSPKKYTYHFLSFLVPQELQGYRSRCSQLSVFHCSKLNSCLQLEQRAKKHKIKQVGHHLRQEDSWIPKDTIHGAEHPNLCFTDTSKQDMKTFGN